jgi:broad specificity phosphatase PhoE
MTAITRRLYLIRHGRADRTVPAVLETALGPQHDPPLDELGRQQARLLARRLALMPAPAAVYCSTLRRARETVAPFAHASGTSVAYRDELAEWFGGAWEMREFEDLLVEHPEVLGLIRSQDPIWHLAPGGEPGAAFQRRVVDAVEAILAEHPEGDVWIVCHGGVINAYVGHVLTIEEQEMFMLPDHTSLNTVALRGDERRLWFLNDTAHLTQPAMFDGP